MKDNTKEILIWGMFAAILAFLSGVLFGAKIVMREAVTQGVAKYQIDEQTGKVSFVYVKP